KPRVAGLPDRPCGGGAGSVGLRHHLLDRLAGGRLGRRLGSLGHRRGGAAAGLGHGLRTRIAVTGDVALALGRLAVALAHRLAPGSLKNRRKDVRPVGPPRGGARWRILPCGRLSPRRASLQCVQLASWTWPWFRRRFTRCPSPTRPGSSRPSARRARWRRYPQSRLNPPSRVANTTKPSSTPSLSQMARPSEGNAAISSGSRAQWSAQASEPAAPNRSSQRWWWVGGMTKVG